MKLQDFKFDLGSVVAVKKLPSTEIYIDQESQYF